MKDWARRNWGTLTSIITFLLAVSVAVYISSRQPYYKPDDVFLQRLAKDNKADVIIIAGRDNVLR